MAIEIQVPKLGLTMEEATLVAWKFAAGDMVLKEQILLVLETDKVTFEMPSPGDGLLLPLVATGSRIEVSEVVGYLAVDKAELDKLSAEHPAAETGALEKAAVKTPAVEAGVPKAAPAPGGRVKASPLARAMAAEHHLDLHLINGTGPGGRIVRADLLAALKEKEKAAVKRTEEIEEPGPAPQKTIRESIPIRGVRKIIFDNMFQSVSQSAQLTLHTEVSAEALVALRDRLTTDGRKVSFNAILVKTAAMALRLHPKINASVGDGAIQVWKQIHIGLAMEANEALIVPVVRTPDLKTIRDIDREIADLIKKLRENRLSPDDLMNGTFTITNLGFADVDFFTPIIRPPESAILGTGRIVKKPVVKKDTLVPEARLALSLTFDHRIIDGAPAARFLKTIKDMIEDPLLMIC
jgi:pyruvate/2-oxoglutarate dehydrogenase complex dihydrolipoamide acyltransferase (E2) component